MRWFVCLFPLIITSGPRIVSNIESAIGERANWHLHVADDECVNAWQKELGAILSLFNVRRSLFTAPVPHSTTEYSRDTRSGAARLSPGRFWNTCRSPLILNQA